jgi:hypothetical protein
LETKGGGSLEIDISAIPAETYIVLVKGEKSPPGAQKLTILQFSFKKELIHIKN